MSTKSRVHHAKPEDRAKAAPAGTLIPPWTASGLLQEYRRGKIEAHPMKIDYDKADFLMRQRIAHEEHVARQQEPKRTVRPNVFVRAWRWFRGGD